MKSRIKIGNFIKNTILKVASDYVGIYTFQNGNQYPAIAVLQSPNSEYPPKGTDVKGLEVVINPGLDVSSTPYLMSRSWILSSDINLIQWDKTKDTYEPLVAIYPVLESIGRVTINPLILGNDLILESRRLTLIQSVLI